MIKIPQSKTCEAGTVAGGPWAHPANGLRKRLIPGHWALRAAGVVVTVEHGGTGVMPGLKIHPRALVMWLL
jgi:hypothetical protein